MAEKKIGKDVYKCEPLTGREPWKLLLDIKQLLVPLGSILAPRNSALFAEAGGKEAVSALAGELFLALGNIDDDAALSMMERLIGLCTVNGDPAVWGMKPSSMQDSLALAAWVLEVQFADFFGGNALQGLGAKLTKLA
jgi:hypothetical protein